MSEADRKLSSLQTWVTAGMCFIIVFAVTVMAVMVWQAVRLSNVANESHAALCAFKNDIERRHEAAVRFVKENPDGIPGISRAQIDQSLDTQQDTLDALGVLVCS